MIQIFIALLCMNASALTLDPGKGKTEFLAVGRPSAIKINGKGPGPAGDLKFAKEGNIILVSGEAAVDLSSLETGIDMRDRHMKETYLEVEKFKSAKLVFTDAKVEAKLFSEGGTAQIPARLDLHGKQQPVQVEMTFSRKDAAVTAVSKFKVKLSDFAISVPKYAGITVADEVQITTETQMPSKAIGETL